MFFFLIVHDFNIIILCSSVARLICHRSALYNVRVSVCLFGLVLSIHIHVRLCIIQNVVDYGFCTFAVRSQCYIGQYEYRTEPDRIVGDFELVKITLQFLKPYTDAH